MKSPKRDYVELLLFKVVYGGGGGGGSYYFNMVLSGN